MVKIERLGGDCWEIIAFFNHFIIHGFYNQDYLRKIQFYREKVYAGGKYDGSA